VVTDAGARHENKSVVTDADARHESKRLTRDTDARHESKRLARDADARVKRARPCNTSSADDALDYVHITRDPNTIYTELCHDSHAYTRASKEMGSTTKDRDDARDKSRRADEKCRVSRTKVSHTCATMVEATNDASVATAAFLRTLEENVVGEDTVFDTYVTARNKHLAANSAYKEALDTSKICHDARARAANVYDAADAKAGRATEEYNRRRTKYILCLAEYEAVCRKCAYAKKRR
jgi:hypothetical protein